LVNSQDRGPTFDHTLKRAAILPQSDHQERRFEGSLRNPGDRAGAKAISAAGSEDIHAIGQQPQNFLLGLGIHRLRVHFTAAQESGNALFAPEMCFAEGGLPDSQSWNRG